MPTDTAITSFFFCISLDIVVDVEKRPVLSFHSWSNLSSKEEKSITIAQSDLPNIDTLYIGVHGAAGNTISNFRLTARRHQPKSSNRMEEDINTEDSVQCDNCGSWIPKRTMMLHERFCLRNNVRCPWGCGVVFKNNSQELENHWHCDKCDYSGSITEKDKHDSYFHQNRTCACGEFKCDSVIGLSKHRKTTCSQKLIICRFCRVSLQ